MVAAQSTNMTPGVSREEMAKRGVRGDTGRYGELGEFGGSLRGALVGWVKLL